MGGLFAVGEEGGREIGMSVQMIQLFKSIEATPTQRLVAYMLADAHNEQTGRCDLSVSSLAALTSLGERTIQEALKSLESAGHLSRVFRTGTSTQYNLTPRSSRTPAGDAPPQQPHHGGANAAPPPPQQPHPTPAAAAPNPEGTVILTGNEPLLLEVVVQPKPDRFDEFWKLYPRKVAKDKAREKWAAVKPEMVDTILAAVKAQTNSRDWQKEDGRFIPHPSTWLHNSRWEDELKPALRSDVQAIEDDGELGFLTNDDAIFHKAKT
jgi:hypothetical protein